MSRASSIRTEKRRRRCWANRTDPLRGPSLTFPACGEPHPRAVARTENAAAATTDRRPRCAREITMKSLGWLTGCALALACAHEGKGVVGESDTNKQGTAAADASQPQAASTADAATAAI